MDSLLLQPPEPLALRLDPELEQLVLESRRVGQSPLLVQGGGGNVSLKDASAMLVKASGRTLRELTLPQDMAGFAWTRVPPLLRAARSSPEAREHLLSLDASLLLMNPSPSIEAWMHALVGRVGVHLHPSSVLVAACRKDWKQVIAESCRGSGVQMIFVDYATPGIPLALELQGAMDASGLGPGASGFVAMLQSHGLLAVGPDVEQAFALASRIESCLKPRQSLVEPGIAAGQVSDYIEESRELAATLSRLGQGRFSPWTTPMARELLDLVQQGVLGCSDILFPDHAVFCGPELLLLSGWDEQIWKQAWDDYLRRWCMEPMLVLHSQGPAAIRSGQTTVVDEILAIVGRILECPRTLLEFLPPQEVSSLVHWKREAMRRSVGR